MEGQHKLPKKKGTRTHASTTISFPRDLLALIDAYCDRIGTDRSKHTSLLWREELGLDTSRTRKKADKKAHPDEQSILPLKDHKS